MFGTITDEELQTEQRKYIDTLLKARQDMEWRYHEYGGDPAKQRVRVWNAAEASYGAFFVLSPENFEILKSCASVAGLALTEAEDN